jgi:uncharacterized protein (TIGR03437 family)
MTLNLLKISVLFVFCALLIAYGFHGTPVGANSFGPPLGNTNAPAESNCTSCHLGPAINTGGGSVTITGLPATYTPNQDIAVTVTVAQASRVRFGFQLTVITDAGAKAGQIIVTDAARTQLQTADVTGNPRDYIFHTTAGTPANGTNQSTWTFTWRAPAASVGRVTFYAAGNATNNSNTNAGDLIYSTNASIQPGGGPLGPLGTFSAANFTPGSSSGAIAAAFGAGLSTNTVPAGLPLPTNLDGTEVDVTDSLGAVRAANLFFVSPGQLNLLIPDGTANGAATVTVKRNGAPFAQGPLAIDTTSPGLFTQNSQGTGTPAAVLFRRRGGVDTFEAISPNTPIDLGPATDIVLLIAFGTGIRGGSQATATATISGTPAPVAFIGPQGELAGLDQANIGIPRSLSGSPDLVRDLVLTVNGKQANTVQIRIQ